MASKIQRSTIANDLRQDFIKRKFPRDTPEEKKVKEAAEHASQERARSISRKPAPLRAVVQRSSSDSQLKIRPRSLLEEYTALKTVKTYGEILIYRTIKLEAQNYQRELEKNRLPYWFFQKIIGDFRKEELTHDYVKALMRKEYPGKKKDAYKLYAKQLSLRSISNPSKIGLDERYSSIEALEAALQVVNTFALLSDAMVRQFKDVFPGSSNKMLYLFELFDNETWLQSTERLDLSFQPLNPNEEKPIGMTWLPTILYTLRLPALNELILTRQHVKSLPRRFLLYSHRLRYCDVSQTPLESFPPDFARTWHLEKLDCRHTKLRALSESFLKNTRHLRILDASHNPYLALIEGNPATAWLQIESIDLSETPIFFFPKLHPRVKINLSQTHVPPQEHSSPSESPQGSRSTPRAITSQLHSIQDQLIEYDKEAVGNLGEAKSACD